MIEIEHRQRLAAAAIVRRRPDIEPPFRIQRLRVIGKGAQIAVRDRAIVKNTAGNQNQAGVHLTLRLLIAAAGIHRAEAVHIKIVFIEIGFHWLAFPCPDPVVRFGHVVRDKGVRRGACHHRNPPGIRGKQAVSDTLIRVNLSDKVAHRQGGLGHRWQRCRLNGERRARQREGEINGMSFHRYSSYVVSVLLSSHHQISACAPTAN